MADGVAADLRRRPRLRLQVGHGLDARHARLHRAATRSTGSTTTTSSRSAGSTRSPRTSCCRCRTTRSCTARARCSARCRATTGSSFANLRLLLGYMCAQPGKKLLFMGGELGQWREWNHDASLDWHLLERRRRTRGLQRWVRDLNRLYRAEPALHELDCDPAGFEWIDCNDAEQSTLAFLRRGERRRRGAASSPATSRRCRATTTGRRAARRALARDAEQRRAALRRQRPGQPRRRRRRRRSRGTARPQSLVVTLPPLAIVVFKGERRRPRLRAPCRRVHRMPFGAELLCGRRHPVPALGAGRARRDALPRRLARPHR